MSVVEPIGRSLARLRDFRWDFYAQPMREMRLEMHVVYFALHMPFAGGVTLNIPVLTTIKPMPSTPFEQPIQPPGTPTAPDTD